MGADCSTHVGSGKCINFMFGKRQGKKIRGRFGCKVKVIKYYIYELLKKRNMKMLLGFCWLISEFNGHSNEPSEFCHWGFLGKGLLSS